MAEHLNRPLKLFFSGEIKLKCDRMNAKEVKGRDASAKLLEMLTSFPIIEKYEKKTIRQMHEVIFCVV